MTVAPSPDRPLRPVRPSPAIQAAYRDRMDDMIDEMQASLVYWITAEYRANPPELAQDESPASALRAAMRKLTRRWQRNFDRAAPKLADYFATAVAARSDTQLRIILREAGISVHWQMTRPANDVLQATIGEQVGLIRSIASQHLSDVEGLVMRSVQQGSDLKTLSAQLHQRYGITKRRAALIARDQNAKATAAITRVRQQEVGITRARWVHSGGGKEPRPTHVAAGRDRLVYDIDKGAYLDGKWVWPGTEINCRCVSAPILPGSMGR